MKGPELLHQVLADLKKIEIVREESDPKKVPQIGYDYVGENREALVALLELAYSDRDQTPDRQRCREALSVIEAAVKWRDPERRAVHDQFTTFESEKFDEIRRALENVRNADVSALDFDLWLSPIENHGLSKPIGNFERPPSVEEWKMVPWRIVDIVYADCRSKINERCRELGLDIENEQTNWLPASFQDDLEVVMGLLIDLLRCRAECVIAGFSVTAIPREKFLNAVINNVDYEAGLLLEKLRLALVHLVPESSRTKGGQALEQAFAPFKIKKKELLTATNDIEPRLTIFETVSRLAREVRSDNEVSRLAEELSMLRAYMQNQVGSTPSAEQQAEIGHVAAAEIEATKGNKKGIMKTLKAAGKWTFKSATEIGTDLLSEVIKKSWGI